MTQSPHRMMITRRPPYLRSGSVAYAMPTGLVRGDAEEAITVHFVSHRSLFGEAYSRLLPDFFRYMPSGSGVFITMHVPTHLLIPSAKHPGDIDLLVVPYEGNQLILENTLAMELKVVRASYDKPGRSPNEFGFTQASALFELGLPYVGLGHLIVSDHSPEHAWQETGVCRVLDQSGNVEMLPNQMVDRLPWHLTDRTFGRLTKRCPRADLGLLAAYVRHSGLEAGDTFTDQIWYPDARPCGRITNPSGELLDAVGKLFNSHAHLWLDTPRFDPQ